MTSQTFDKLKFVELSIAQFLMVNGISYTQCLKIAENKNWINEIVAAKTSIGQIYMFEKNYSKAEELYSEAISSCENNSKCSSDQLDVTFGYLNFLYLYQMKDISKSQNLIDKIKASKIFANANITNEKVCYYISEIRSAGYEKESANLMDKEDCRK